jgi:hypothetical protein
MLKYKLAPTREQDNIDIGLIKTTNSEQRYVDLSLASVLVDGRAIRVSSIKEQSERFSVVFEGKAFMPLEEIDEIVVVNREALYPK